MSALLAPQWRELRIDNLGALSLAQRTQRRTLPVHTKTASREATDEPKLIYAEKMISLLFTSLIIFCLPIIACYVG